MGGHRAHTVYLAIIAILILVVVYFGARAARAGQVAADVQERFGLGREVHSSAPREGGAVLRSGPPPALQRERTYEQLRAEVDQLVEAAAQGGDFGTPGELQQAVLRALKGGKRLRPIILIELCRTVRARGRNSSLGVDPAEAALALEYLHTASLIIDDDPAFDNDTTRRGAPTIWAKEGSATAHLAALTLVSGAFQNFCRQVDWVRDYCPEFGNPDRLGTQLCSEASAALARQARGQKADIAADGAPGEATRNKTSPLFAIAFTAGWLLGGGGEAGLPDLRYAGEQLGIAFQIADDLGDSEADRARSAKNYANVYGKEHAAREIDQRLNACKDILESRGLFTPVWREIYDRLWAMSGNGIGAGAEANPGKR